MTQNLSNSPIEIPSPNQKYYDFNSLQIRNSSNRNYENNKSPVILNNGKSLQLNEDMLASSFSKMSANVHLCQSNLNSDTWQIPSSSSLSPQIRQSMPNSTFTNKIITDAQPLATNSPTSKLTILNKQFQFSLNSANSNSPSAVANSSPSHSISFPTSFLPQIPSASNQINLSLSNVIHQQQQNVPQLDFEEHSAKLSVSSQQELINGQWVS